jgi:hypothetical protein
MARETVKRRNKRKLDLQLDRELEVHFRQAIH